MDAAFLAYMYAFADALIAQWHVAAAPRPAWMDTYEHTSAWEANARGRHAVWNCLFQRKALTSAKSVCSCRRSSSICNFARQCNAGPHMAVTGWTCAGALKFDQAGDVPPPPITHAAAEPEPP
eukprot:1145370-Pelagomonas_calceolata.AAC.2